LLGVIRIPPQHWRMLFFVPAIVLAIVATLMAFFVKETPEQAGFSRQDPDEPHDPADNTKIPLRIIVGKIVSNPAVWICALAYACTGAVRQGIDQWFPRYMQEVYNTDMKSAQFQILAFSIPLVATLGSLTSGYASDLLFNGKRAPVAAFLYLVETIIIIAATFFHGANAAIIFFVLIAFTANSTHSIIGTAAAMDIGGRKMAGFASGCIDSFQYFGGMLAGFALGSIVEKHWGNYFWFMVPFGVLGAALMFFGRHIVEGSTKRETYPAPVAQRAPAKR
jgi:sugar phosphate permease